MSISRHKHASCSGKHKHLSERKALAHASSVYNTSGVKVKPYRCIFCNFWHVGHPMNEMARKEWDREFNG